MPPTIQALLAARLDQLDPSERFHQVLERGSIEGQLFHAAAVEALASPPASAARSGWSHSLRENSVRPDRAQLGVGDAYRFRHLLIRDAAYDALPKACRAELHEKFAAWARGAAATSVERDEIVAYHLERAYRYRAELGSGRRGAGCARRRAPRSFGSSRPRARRPVRGRSVAPSRRRPLRADTARASARPGRPALRDRRAGAGHRLARRGDCHGTRTR